MNHKMIALPAFALLVLSALTTYSPASASPSLVVFPASGPSGTIHGLSATGFAPGTIVSVSISSNSIGTFEADQNGAFFTEFLVPQGLPLGTAKIEADDANTLNQLASANLLITGVTATSGTAFTNPSSPVNLALNASDSLHRPLTFSITTAPAHGVLTGVSPNVVYTPNSGFSGLDSFVFKAQAAGDSSSAKVWVIVGKCNCVVYRLDDIGDFFLSHIQATMFGLFMNKTTPLGLPIVMKDFGEDATVMTPLINGVSGNLFEPDIHAWIHSDMSKWTYQQQLSNLTAAQQKMTSMFGKPTKTFVVPQDNFNNDTLTALAQQGFSTIASVTSTDNYPYFNAGDSNSNAGNSLDILHVPSTTADANLVGTRWVDTSTSQMLASINASISDYGYAVVTSHPQDFSVPAPNGTLTDVVNQTQLSKFSGLMDAISAHGITTTTFQVVSSFPHNPPLPSTGAPLPTITITTPTNGTSAHGTLHFTGTVSDPVPVISVEVGGYNNGLSYDVANPNSPGNWSSWNLDYDVPSGTQNVLARVTDVQGRVAWTSLTLANSPPTVAFTSPANNANLPSGTVLFTGNTTGGSPISKVELSIDGNAGSYQLATPKAPGDWSTWSINYNLPTGSHWFTVRVTDSLNRQAWNSLTLVGQ